MKISFQEKNKRIFLLIISLLFVILVLFIFIKNPLFEKLARNKIKNIDNQYSIDINFEKIKLQGLKKITISNLCVKNENLDLLKFDQLEIKFSLLKIFFGKMKIKTVKIENLKINFFKDSNNCSYNIVAISENDDTTKTSKSGTDYFKRSLSVFHIIERIIPSNMQVNKLEVAINYFGSRFNINCENAVIRNNELNALFEVSDNSYKGLYQIDYQFSPSKDLLEMSSRLVRGQLVPLPIISKKYGLFLSGNKMHFSFQLKSSASKVASYSGKLNFTHTKIYNRRISNDTINVKSLNTTFNMNAWKSGFEIDSSSFIKLNNFKFHPYFKFDRTKGKEVVIDFHAPKFKVNDLIEAIPKGLLSNLENMKADGELSYRLHLAVDLNLPDSLKFYTKLSRYNFRVSSFGNLNFGRLQEEFEYTAFKNGNPVRTFIVGPSNPDFVPIENIPEWLKQSVIFSEDGAFYYHAGFIPDAIKDAIITNIKRRKFARGGSTISMQFVKNLFLSSKKVLTRKIEEIIITWLMENYRLLSKDRIFEIYLNVIEWGPNIYGVGEACDFYFAKPLNKLTLAESIFMASVIPHPASFYYAFGVDGKLRSHYNWHYKNVSGRMLKKEVITQNDYDNLMPEISLTGPANDFLKKDEIVADSIELLIPEVK